MDAILQFTVTNQTMERTDEFTVVEGSENYLRARFTFATPDWDGLIKTAVFIDEDGDIHPSLCADDICEVPPEWLVKQKGYVGLIGSDGTIKITTGAVKVNIKEKGYVSGGEIEEEAQAYFDQLLAAFSDKYLEAEAQAKLAKRWAVGLEEEPDTLEDNAKYYAGQAKQTLEDTKAFTESEKQNIVALSESEQEKISSIKDEAISARNTAIENANIATNKADETEADKQTTEANKAATAADKEATAANLAESQRILQEQIQMLGTVPMIYAVTTLEELQAFTGAKEGDFGIIQEPRAMLFRYYTKDINGNDLNPPAWQWMTDLNITFTRDSLLNILSLADIALTGSYNDLQDVPNRYDSPIVLDGTADTITWNYTQSDTAIVTLTENKPLEISNPYNGCVAVIQVYGAQLDFSDTSIYNKSATLDYIEPLEAEHITYTLICNAGKWDVTALVYAGGEADA